MRRLILIIHNVRSAHNVGSLLRTAEGLGLHKVYMSGYTPYPQTINDKRLLHERQRATQQISKTGLGAEQLIDWEHILDIDACLEDIKNQGFMVAALEQTHDSTNLNSFKQTADLAVIVGNELTGIENEVLRKVDVKLQIPMSGHKESFNVAVAAAMALYRLRYR